MNPLRLRGTSSLLIRCPPTTITPHTNPLLRSTTNPIIPIHFHQQLRHKSWFDWSRRKDDDIPSSSANESRSLLSFLKSSPRTTPQHQSVPIFEKGGLASTSIFGSDPTDTDAGASPLQTRIPTNEDYHALVDPYRATSWSWPKRFEARQYRRRGRLTRRMQILQTERAHTAKSHWIKTSVKKLSPLARQISGLPLNDAIVQMRFSPKKASSDVLNLLGEARMEAIVRRGMKDGEMFVSEAWVGRGTYEKQMSHRARGRIDMLRKPYTSITIVLKENATKERIKREKEAKKARKKVWVHLPNRPIYGQQQYYQW